MWGQSSRSCAHTEETNFIVYSGASCAYDEQGGNACRERDHHSFEEPTTVVTANGTQRTTEQATYVKDLDMIVTVQLLKDSPALFLWKNSAISIHEVRP